MDYQKLSLLFLELTQLPSYFFTEDNDIISLDVSFQVLNYFTFSVLGNVFLPFRID